MRDSCRGGAGVQGGKCRRLSVTSTAAVAAVMVGGIFVCSCTAPPYSLLAEHYTVHVGSGCCGSGLGTGTGLAGAPSADSESSLATGMTSGRGMVLATSLDCRGLWLWHN